MSGEVGYAGDEVFLQAEPPSKGFAQCFFVTVFEVIDVMPVHVDISGLEPILIGQIESQESNMRSMPCRAASSRNTGRVRTHIGNGA